jgi:hypothetical protein
MSGLGGGSRARKLSTPSIRSGVGFALSLSVMAVLAVLVIDSSVSKTTSLDFDRIRF